LSEAAINASFSPAAMHAFSASTSAPISVARRTKTGPGSVALPHSDWVWKILSCISQYGSAPCSPMQSAATWAAGALGWSDSMGKSRKITRTWPCAQIRIQQRRFGLHEVAHTERALEVAVLADRDRRIRRAAEGETLGGEAHGHTFVDAGGDIGNVAGSAAVGAASAPASSAASPVAAGADAASSATGGAVSGGRLSDEHAVSTVSATRSTPNMSSGRRWDLN
jgi:hypothetical protein